MAEYDDVVRNNEQILADVALWELNQRQNPANYTHTVSY